MEKSAYDCWIDVKVAAQRIAKGDSCGSVERFFEVECRRYNDDMADDRIIVTSVHRPQEPMAFLITPEGQAICLD